jgi:hypothetical protein
MGWNSNWVESFNDLNPPMGWNFNWVESLIGLNPIVVWNSNWFGSLVGLNPLLVSQYPPEDSDGLDTKMGHTHGECIPPPNGNQDMLRFTGFDTRVRI